MRWTLIGSVAAILLLAVIVHGIGAQPAAAPNRQKWEYAALHKSAPSTYSLHVNGDQVWEFYSTDKEIYKKLGVNRDPKDSDIFAAIVATSLGREGWELVATSDSTMWFKRPAR
jgi:hypothetical protein